MGERLLESQLERLMASQLEEWPVRRCGLQDWGQEAWGC